MSIKTSLLKKIVFSALLLVMCSAANAYQVTGVINAFWVYPTYSVIFLTNSPATSGPAGCVNDNGFTLSWSQFDVTTQQRIMSMLLTARTTKQPGLSSTF